MQSRACILLTFEMVRGTLGALDPTSLAGAERANPASYADVLDPIILLARSRQLFLLHHPPLPIFGFNNGRRRLELALPVL